MGVEDKIKEALYFFDESSSSRRSYGMGAGKLGSSCDRYLFLSYRWAGKRSEIEDKRVLRLLETGNREEERVFSSLALRFYLKEQIRINFFNDHISGYIDGFLIIDGLCYLAEIKTANDRNFKQIAKGGVKVKGEHYAQIQTYLHYLQGVNLNDFIKERFIKEEFLFSNLEHTEIQGCIYIVINKNDDDVHIELVPYNQEDAQGFIDRGLNIILAEEIPKKIADSGDAYSCRYCSMKELCHEKAIPEKNCRTCTYSTPDIGSGGWLCDKKHIIDGRKSDKTPEDAIDPEVGCDDHVFIPQLLPFEPIDHEVIDGADFILYRDSEGRQWVDGSGQALRMLPEEKEC